jgi:hypothetical protein
VHDKIGFIESVERMRCRAGTNGNGRHEQSMAFQSDDIGPAGKCIRLPCSAPSRGGRLGA